MQRKLVVLTAGLLALCLLLAACAPAAVAPTNAPATSAPATNAPATAAPSASAAPDDGEALPSSTWLTQEKAELEVYYVLNPGIYVTDYVDNRATEWLENYTNVHIVWNFIQGEEAATRLTLVMSTPAEMPDVFMSPSMSRAQVDAYGSQGLLLPLQDYINGVSVHYKDIVTKNPKVLQQSTSFDGNVYFLPRYYESVHVRHSQKMWINTTWLDRLGLALPETTDDFYEVLKAFKEQDANGNGDPNDEIPLTANKSGISYNGHVQSFLMNAFVYSPVGDSRIVEDGVVKYAYAQDGWKEGLKYYHRLYDEGLLDQECLVLVPEQNRALSSDPAGNRLGAFAGAVKTENVDTASPQIFEYTTIAPLVGPTGLQQAPLEDYIPTPFFALSAVCRDPELAFRWGDIQMQDALAQMEAGDYEFMTFWYGPEDDPMGFSRAAPGETGFTGKPAYYKTNFHWGDYLNTHWYEWFLINMPREWKERAVSTPIEGVYDQERDLYEQTVANYEPYATDKTLPVLSLTSEESAEFAEISATLGTYYNESFARFLNGEWDIDGQWDAYIAELNNIGMQRALEISQTAYDRTY